MVCFCAVIKLRNVHYFSRQKPVSQFVFAFSGGFCSDHSKKLVFKTVGICKSGCDLKHESQSVHFFLYQLFPQIAVLKQARSFITHGGMNSVSEAMMCGVPMVVIPFVSDQPVNARQVQKLGLGKVLDYKTIAANTLTDAAFAVMQDRQIRENLRKIQEEIAYAPGNAGTIFQK